MTADCNKPLSENEFSHWFIVVADWCMHYHTAVLLSP